MSRGGRRRAGSRLGSTCGLGLRLSILRVQWHKVGKASCRNEVSEPATVIGQRPQPENQHAQNLMEKYLQARLDAENKSNERWAAEEHA